MNRYSIPPTHWTRESIHMTLYSITPTNWTREWIHMIQYSFPPTCRTREWIQMTLYSFPPIHWTREQIHMTQYSFPPTCRTREWIHMTKYSFPATYRTWECIHMTLYSIPPTYRTREWIHMTLYCRAPTKHIFFILARNIFFSYFDTISQYPTCDKLLWQNSQQKLNKFEYIIFQNALKKRAQTKHIFLEILRQNTFNCRFRDGDIQPYSDKTHFFLKRVGCDIRLEQLTLVEWPNAYSTVPNLYFCSKRSIIMFIDT